MVFVNPKSIETAVYGILYEIHISQGGARHLEALQPIRGHPEPAERQGQESSHF